ncbi:MAG: methyltransferase [Bacteroidetes bacterium SW_4_67_19]|jgi:caffeoyl-CoA O-methyltransferase|nr:MAG: methyltransferase [Bacteroidetes bacterium SW_4_67_19]
MSNRSHGLSEAFHEYLLSVSLREPPVLERLREETRQHPRSEMQSAPEQGQFMRLLATLIDAERTLEIGVFTGYSALSVALALPDEGGRVVGCDVSPDYTSVAERFFEEAGIRSTLDLRIGPARQTLDALLGEEDAAETFDFAFIDADKEQYDAYYERALRLVRPGGLILLDNVFRGGKVAEAPGDVDESVRAIQRLNDKLHDDERVDLSMIPVADGLTLARKR